MFSYARRDLLRNPRRTIASLVGVVLGVGLFSGVLFAMRAWSMELFNRRLFSRLTFPRSHLSTSMVT